MEVSKLAQILQHGTTGATYSALSYISLGLTPQRVVGIKSNHHHP